MTRCGASFIKPALKTVYEFPLGTWVENIAVRNSGDLLVTLIDRPEIHLIDPFEPDNTTTIYSFPHATSVLGIAEFQPDQFAVVVGNFSLTALATVPGSYSIWKVDMRSFISHGSRVFHPATVKKVVDIPEGNFLNGLTILEESKKLVLVSDSGLGAVWLVDLVTGKHHITLQDSTMVPLPNATSVPGTLGINGVKIRDSHLYYTNSAQALFAKIPIHKDGTPAGNSTVLATDRFGDDFAFDIAGNAYVTQDPQNTLYKVTPSGNVSTVLGAADSPVIEGDTAAQFGRTRIDQHILYITTNGGIAGPVGGPAVGGKVIAFNTLSV
ncbi:hypothetical protein F5884DRAFT_818622 [Xylogone sp. PMI_703]|nr:hypothetical protein F5884DRAFT_818622 [Xylogone sp. PMI_703]